MTETLTWNGEDIAIFPSDNGKRWFEKDGLKYTLPDWARVYRVFLPGDSGKAVIKQHPGVRVQGDVGGSPHDAITYNLLGLDATWIGSDRFMWPSELPDVLTHVQNVWGWEVSRTTAELFNNLNLGQREPQSAVGI